MTSSSRWASRRSSWQACEATASPRALGAGEEVDLAEEVAGLEQAERVGAVGRRALDGDLALLEHVEVGAGRALGEDLLPLLVLLLGERLGELEDLLVAQVAPGVEVAQPRRQLDAAAASHRPGLGRHLQALLAEALAVPLQAVEGDAQLLLPLVEDVGEPLVAPGAPP